MYINGQVSCKKAKTLSDFLRDVATMRDQWSLPIDEELWFRGEGRKYDFNLRPELYRSRPGKCLRLTDELLDIESKLHNEFMRCAPQLINDKLDNDYWAWDSYFLLQHHGGATRLLDWSDGALIALHFAVRSAEDEDAFVYILKWSTLNDRLKAIHNDVDLPNRWRAYVKAEKLRESSDLDEGEYEDAYLPRDNQDRTEFAVPDAPLILDIPHITRRVAAQRSRFIVFGRDPHYLAEEFNRNGSSIKAICVDGACRAQIRQELRDAGVTESLIFPDLDGLGREMKQLWQERRDRAPS